MTSDRGNPPATAGHQPGAVPASAAELPGEAEGRMVPERLRETIASQFGRSLHIRTLDTGSCAVCEQEIRLLTAPHYDLQRLGF